MSNIIFGQVSNIVMHHHTNTTMESTSPFLDSIPGDSDDKWFSKAPGRVPIKEFFLIGQVCFHKVLRCHKG